MESNNTKEHHELGPNAVKKENDITNKIVAAILKHRKWFAAEGYKMHYVIIMPTSLISIYQ